MSIKKRSSTWYVDFRFDGERIRKKSPVNTSAGAKNYESILRQKLLKGESIEKNFDDNLEQPFKDYIWMWFEKYAKANNRHSEILTKEYIIRLHLVPYFGRTRLNKCQFLEILNQKLLNYKETFLIKFNVNFFGDCRFMLV